MVEIKGYKVFNHDWTCRGFQYTCPGIFEEDVDPEVCERGFHFCLNLADCFGYYPFNPENKVAEIICLGKIAGKGDKCCTNKIEIVRELTWEEVLRLVNTGNHNTGNHNTGDCNTGNHNTGNRNTGNWNTGDCNTGNWNTGNWNKSSFNTGCFMTEERKIPFFNKPSDWTYQDWLGSDAWYLLNQIPKSVVKWIYSYNMTDEEKAAHPGHKTTGGYLKVLDESECGQIWWDGLSDYHRDIIRALPNFDATIFEQCTGINVEK